MEKLFKVLFFIALFLVFFVFFLNIFSILEQKKINNVQSNVKKIVAFIPVKYSNVQVFDKLSEASFPTPILTSTPTPISTPKPTLPPPTPTIVWGKASQVSEHSWTMNIQNDDRMATPGEILTALNDYRNRHGRSTLSLDDNLVKYAQSRSDKFQTLGETDEHTGFNDYLKDNDNFKKLGFGKLGENSASGYRLYGVHIIEWIFAGDKPHDDNQLDSEWSHVGIGVNETMVDLVFGGDKM